MINYKYEQRKLLLISILSFICIVIVLLTQGCSDKIYQSTIYQVDTTIIATRDVCLKGKLTNSEIFYYCISGNIDSLKAIAIMNPYVDIYKENLSITNIDTLKDTVFYKTIMLSDRHSSVRAKDNDSLVYIPDVMINSPMLYIWRGWLK